MEKIYKKLSKDIEAEINEYISKKTKEFDKELIELKEQFNDEISSVKNKVITDINDAINKMNENVMGFDSEIKKIQELKTAIKTIESLTSENMKFMKKFNKDKI